MFDPPDNDDQENFSSLLSLYNKSSLNLTLDFDLRNSPGNDLFTLKDSTMNETLRSFYGRVGDSVGGQSDAKEGVDTVMGPSANDNQDIFSDLLNLHSKGSLDTDTIYELLNLDPEDVQERLYKSLVKSTAELPDPAWKARILALYDDEGDQSSD